VRNGCVDYGCRARQNHFHNGGSLKNFLETKNRDGVARFEWADQPTGQVVDVDLHYSKGGVSYFSGNNFPRGIYLRLAEVTRKKTEWGTTTAFKIGGRSGEWGERSKTFLLEQTARGNPKRLAVWAELFDDLLPELAAAFRSQDDEEVKRLTILQTCKIERAAKPAKAAAPAVKRLEMKPLPKYVLDRLPPLYSQEEKGVEALVQAKFFTPDGAATWYATEFDGTDRFFGYVDLGIPGCAELGYFSLSELKEVRGKMGLPVELDRYWSPKPLSQVMS
jgi:hypothetical protein